MAVVEEKIKTDRDLRIDYYISMKEDGTVRNSDKYNFNLVSLSHNLFGILHGSVTLDRISISAALHEMRPANPQYTIEEVFLESRKGKDRMVERWQMEVTDPVDARGNPIEPDRSDYNVNVTPTEDTIHFTWW